MEKQIDLLLLDSSSKTNTIKTVENPSEKSEPSLFDNLIKGSLKDSTTDVTNNVKSINEKIENPQVDNKEVKSEDKENRKEAVKTSLLDRLIQEAKKEVKEVNPEEVKKVQDNLGQSVKSIVQENIANVNATIKKENLQTEINNTTTQVTNEKIDLPENIKELKSDVEIVNAKQLNSETIIKTDELEDNGILDDSLENKTVNVKSEDKENRKEAVKTSLLDRLIQEAKKEVKEVNPEEVKKVQDNLGQSVKSIVQENIANVNATIKKENLQTEINNTTTQVTNEKIDNNSNEKSVEKQNIQKVENIVNTSNETLNSLEEKTINIVRIASNDLENKKVSDEILSTNSISTSSADNKTTLIEEVNISSNPKTNEVLTQNLIDTEENNIGINTKVAKELAALNTNEIETIKVSKDLLDSNIKQVDNKSLMDQLIEKNRLDVFGNSNNVVSDKKIKSDEFLTSIYLSSQKSQISSNSLFNKKEAVSILSNGSTLGDIKTSADKLELGLEDIDVQKVVENIKKLDLENLDRRNLLDRLAFNKNIVDNNLKNMITTSVEASKALLEDTINVLDDMGFNVNSTLAQSIQSRIIGAKQQMTQMMSDFARQMYENYRPPVTAFRINLNPATLGAISILMKNDRDNAISISMNISNSATLDAIKESQSILRSSLNNVFNNETEFSFDFGSSDGNSESSSNQNSQSNSNSSSQLSTQSILQINEENKDIGRNLDYM